MPEAGAGSASDGFAASFKGAPGYGLQQESRSLLPWVLSGAVVLLVLGVLLIAGQRKAPANPGGAGLAPPDAYAGQLAISQVQMSESTNLSGGKVTYLDGVIANHGSKTLRAVTVQVAFRNALQQIAQKETMPLNPIRTRQPYVDIQPMSAAPLTPGSSREFRLIFDHVTDDWDQQYPEVRVIAVEAK
jgi:hypothetical protein